MGARVGNNTVSRAGLGRVAKVGDDRMGADRWIDPQVAEGRQERMSFGQLSDTCRVFPSESCNERAGVIANHDRRAGLAELATTVAEPRSQVAEEAAGKRASTMRGRNEDDPTNFRNA